MKAYQATYSVIMLCRMLEVYAIGYYAWLHRAPSKRRKSDLLLGDRIESLQRQSRENYARERLQADLRDEDIHASDKRGIHGAARRQTFKTTIRERDARPAPDPVERQFVASAPNELWVADIRP